MKNTTKKYLKIIKSGLIQESEIISLRSYLSNTNTPKNEKQAILNAFYAFGRLKITEKQAEKGLKFLNSLRFTPKGKDRKNNPYGHREEVVLNDFQEFRLVGLHNAGNAFVDYYLPIYEVIGSNDAFQYYYDRKLKLNIIG